MNAKIAISAVLDKLTTMKDGGAKIVFETQELAADALSNLFRLRNTLGWLVFVPSQEVKAVIPEKPPAWIEDEKSCAQRQRGALYALWKESGEPGNSEDFYRKRINQNIEAVKDEIDIIKSKKRFG